MKAVTISKNGGPEVLEIKDIKLEDPKSGGPEVLELKDITLDKLSPDQVTIEQKAIGLNYIDTYHRSGLYPLKLPIGLGLEGAGIITDVGESVCLLYTSPSPRDS